MFTLKIKRVIGDIPPNFRQNWLQVGAPRATWG